MRRLRDGTDMKTIIRQIKDGDLLLQLSLVPETRYRYEFPFFPDMPSYLLQRSNPYLNSALYEQAFLNPSPSPQNNLNPPTAASPYLKPIHAAQLIEPLMSAVRLSKWTTVSSDDQLLRRLLESYLLYEYEWFPVFQKDHFLRDMADGRNRFCSSLLVNAVLAAACVSYSTHCEQSTPNI
jgi:hypothetical protein